jgi:hypothetical protein
VTLGNHTDRVDWPATLSSYAKGNRLQFVTRGPHPFVWVAVPFALMLGALGVAGIAGVGTSGLVSAIAGIGATAFAVAVLMSAAYSTWGVMELERRGSEWIVTRCLGRVRSVSAFAADRIRSAELYSPPPFVALWPGGAGLHVRVHMLDRERPIELGAGLRLDGPTLHSLQTLFTPIP